MKFMEWKEQRFMHASDGDIKHDYYVYLNWCKRQNIEPENIEEYKLKTLSFKDYIKTHVFKLKDTSEEVMYGHYILYCLDNDFQWEEKEGM